MWGTRPIQTQLRALTQLEAERNITLEVLLRNVNQGFIALLGEAEKQTSLLEEIAAAIVERPAVRLAIHFNNEEKESYPMETRKLPIDSQIGVTLNPTNKNGGPALVQPGSVKIVQDNDGIVAVQSATNELNFTLQGNKEGIGTVAHFEADADLGDGVTTIVSDEFKIEVEALGAVGFGITFGPIEPQGPPVVPPSV